MLQGYGGNDRIFGGIGQDNLLGSWGKDKLKGEDDNDRLDGGFDDDVLTGGGGANQFEPSRGNDPRFACVRRRHATYFQYAACTTSSQML